MRTPGFWSRCGFLALLLWPLSVLYNIGRMLKKHDKPTRVSVPVICVGNATAGGAGKTPVALAVGQILKDQGINAFFLSRGYGGSIGGPVLVDAEKHSSAEVGDEPLLLSGLLPTIVCANRVAGAEAAILHGAKAIIMDDGFQNPSLEKTLSLLVIDSNSGFGNGLLLPAGPLREPKNTAFKRADAVIVIGNGKNTPKLPVGIPTLRARIAPKPPAQELAGKIVYAFCGIAHPQKFFDTLTSIGAQIGGKAVYPDHAPYTAKEVLRLAVYAKAEQAPLVTTAKDAARLPADLRRLVQVVEIELLFEKPAELQKLLSDAMA